MRIVESAQSNLLKHPERWTICQNGVKIWENKYAEIIYRTRNHDKNWRISDSPCSNSLFKIWKVNKLCIQRDWECEQSKINLKGLYKHWGIKLFRFNITNPDEMSGRGRHLKF